MGGTAPASAWDSVTKGSSQLDPKSFLGAFGLRFCGEKLIASPLIPQLSPPPIPPPPTHLWGRSREIDFGARVLLSRYWSLSRRPTSPRVRGRLPLQTFGVGRQSI